MQENVAFRGKKQYRTATVDLKPTVQEGTRCVLCTIVINKL